MDNLKLALAKAQKGKTWQSNVRRVMKDPEEYLSRLQVMLEKQEFHTSGYTRKFVYEPKKREIFVLPFYPDRIVHHAVMNVLEPIWESFFIKDSYACRPRKGQHLGSKRCKTFVRRNDYVLQCDVSKFYPSIKHKELKSIIRRKIKDPKMLRILDDLIDSIDGVPIGNYTSQWFGNIFLNDLDTKVKQEWQIKDYFRYCDDFFIFGSKAQLQEIKPKVLDYIHNDLKLRLSRCQLYPVSRGVDALGYRHFPSGKVLVRKTTVARLKRRLKAMPHELKRGRLSRDRGLGQLASANGLLKHANTYNLRMKLRIPELKELVNQYGTV